MRIEATDSDYWYRTAIEIEATQWTSGKGTFYGNWEFPSTASATSTDSDKKLKHSIVSIFDLEQYGILFDNLNPTIYKYINGTSDRIHVGFIAQEVKNAMDLAKLTT